MRKLIFVSVLVGALLFATIQYAVYKTTVDHNNTLHAYWGHPYQATMLKRGPIQWAYDKNGNNPQIMGRNDRFKLVSYTGKVTKSTLTGETYWRKGYTTTVSFGYGGWYKFGSIGYYSVRQYLMVEGVMGLFLSLFAAGVVYSIGSSIRNWSRKRQHLRLAN